MLELSGNGIRLYHAPSPYVWYMSITAILQPLYKSKTLNVLTMYSVIL